MNIVQKIFSATFILMAISGAAVAQESTEITVSTAGSLKDKMLGETWEEVKSIKISGPINAEDINVLSKLTKKDEGKLSVLDLSQAQMYLLGDEAFAEGINLTKVTLPSGITAIGNSAFGGCKNLTSINIPAKVTAIGNYAFAECSNLSAINIPDGVSRISDGCFADCNKLSSIILPKHITHLGKESFARTSLTRIDIPADVISIGGAAFAGCDKLAFIKVDLNNKKYCSTAGGVLYSKDGKYILQYPAGKTGTLYTIPEGVVRVGSYSFAGCQNLTKITIPNSCSSVGYGAFYECLKLKDIVLPPSITVIDEDVFYGCKNLSEINIPSGVKSIGPHAFYGCTALKSIKLPNGITTIGQQSFFGCSNLNSINLSNGITAIGASAFASCSKLSLVKLPESLNYLGDGAFYGDSLISEVNIPKGISTIGLAAFTNCSKLSNIQLASGLKMINDAAFGRCIRLSSINIPASVDSIGMGAFANCDSLSRINLNNTTPPKANLITGYDLSDTISLIVPAGSEEVYHKAKGWCEFQHINNKYYEVEHIEDEPDMNGEFQIDSNKKIPSGSMVFTTNEADKSASTKIIEDVNIYADKDVDKKAYFTNGSDAWNQFLKSTVHYPDYITKTANNGIVKLKFVVEKNGSVSHIEVIQSQGDDLDAEAVSTLFSSPSWTPAQKDGKVVRSTTQTDISIFRNK